MKTKYIAYDGKEFDDDTACLDYEAKLYAEKRQAVLEAVKNIDEQLWNKYFPHHGTTYEPQLHQVYLWLEADIPYIVLHSETHPTLDNIKSEILSIDKNFGNEIISNLDFESMEEIISIKCDWENSLRSIRTGRALSSPIGYSLDLMDLKNLATLHKANKFKKKIETLLTNCNFHKECSDFKNKHYDEYLSYKDSTSVTRLISLQDGTTMGDHIYVFKTNAPIEELKKLEKVSCQVYLEHRDSDDVPIWSEALSSMGYIFEYQNECTNVTPFTCSSKWLKEEYPEIEEHYLIENQPEL